VNTAANHRPTVSRRRRLLRASAPLLFGVIGAGAIGLPLAASLIDTQADHPGRFSVVLWVGWIITAVLTALVGVHFLQRVLSSPSAVLAMAYDALPILLVGAWLLVIPALATGHHLLGALTIVLCVYHMHLVVPRFRTAPVPRWVADAPAFTLCVANVYVDNPTPAQSARALIAAGADVIVIVESTPKFIREFDAAGGADLYPNRVSDPQDSSDYAVTIVSRLTLADGSAAERHGDLRLMRAVVDVGVPVQVLGVNPMATVDPGGYTIARAQLRDLARLVRQERGPLLVAGDLNMSRYRPEFAALLASGLHDVHDTLGKGLSMSFKLRASGWLAAFGPVARLDHALASPDLHPLAVTELDANGSDHVPFVVTLAVREGSRSEASRSEGSRSEVSRPEVCAAGFGADALG
jgi:endonuclease/exonuclease/phosphatase (EEP) superfamily protein YafD